MQTPQTRQGCKTAHAWAVSSLCVVIESRPVLRAWPFKIESVDFGDVKSAAEGAPRSGEGAALSKVPDGNHGDHLSGATKHD